MVRARRPLISLLAIAWMVVAGSLAGPFASPPLAADGFVAGIDDLPLMPGLTSMPESSVAFDSPAGRIVEAYAAGTATRAAISEFYRRTLPQLGWQPAGTNAFRREGEQLKLDFPDRPPPGAGAGRGRVVVRFFLSPG
ncbi:MAG TPA: hypothetical protein VLG66_15010 [Alphaproteobacteria bacterium]|jgi:hypothetical protein|nr:hypothetical protein [Alphaproteobacteria bacterium]